MVCQRVSREAKSDATVVSVGNHHVGGGEYTWIAGPCSVESQSQIIAIAQKLKERGAHMLRGGAFKPRSSPYSFQGLGETGLKYLAAARAETGMPIVSEVMDPRDVSLCAAYVDVLQIGARNMQNYPLLRAVGQTNKPVLLKRGFGATIDEWLWSAEYILAEGNPNVILCERGIRTFETATRNTLDLSAVPVVKERSHLPILVDPSHGTGVSRYVPAMSRAAAAAGADGLILEVHENPETALSDGKQTITPEVFGELVTSMRHLLGALKRMESPPQCSKGAELSDYRMEIDALDEQITMLLAARVEISRSIGAWKQQRQYHVAQPERFQQVIEHVLSTGTANGLNEPFLRALYGLIHKESCSVQERELAPGVE